MTGATEIVQTQSANVATTLQVKQLQQLPVITHTALDYVVSLPGVGAGFHRLFELGGEGRVDLYLSDGEVLWVRRLAGAAANR